MTDLIAATTGLTVRLRLVSANSGRPLSGMPVSLSQCGEGDRIHLTDGEGWAEFGADVPAAQPDHWPHVHVETPAGRARLGLPAACGTAYAKGTPSRDGLAAAFRDGSPLAMASVTGDAQRGFVATYLIKLTPVRG
jgi:hypothetical protein